MIPLKDQKTCHTIFVNLLLATEVIMEGMEALSLTNKFRHSLKQAAQRYYNETEKYSNDEISCLWNTDKDAVYHLMGRMKSLIQKLILVKPEMWGILDEIIKKWEEQPEYIMDVLNIIHGNSDHIDEMKEREEFINRVGKMGIKGVRQVSKYADSLNNIYALND